MLPYDPWDLLGKAWIALAGVLMWTGKRHFDEDRRVAERVGALEKTCATREDVSSLRESMEDGHRTILAALLKRD